MKRDRWQNKKKKTVNEIKGHAGNAARECNCTIAPVHPKQWESSRHFAEKGQGAGRGKLNAPAMQAIKAEEAIMKENRESRFFSLRHSAEGNQPFFFSGM